MLRLAEVADAPGILQTRIAAIRALASSHYPNGEIEAWCSSRSAETYIAAIEQHAVLVYELLGQIVAFGHVNVETARIEALYVSPSYARRGVGLQVLRALEAKAAAHGVAWLGLEASLNAVAFYRRAGYVDVAPMPPGDTGHRLVIDMRRQLGCADAWESEQVTRGASEP
jgi:putative acetyltransferase